MVKQIKQYILCLSLLLIPSIGQARIFAQWGVASSHPGTTKYSDVKFVEFGKSGSEGKLAYTCGIGGWHDGSGYVGGSGITIKDVNTGHVHSKGGELQEKARDSFFVETLLGVEPISDHFYISYKLGPAIISHTDALLGSNLQIGHELSFGMRDNKEVRVGIVLKHFSNAGLLKPNLGRDFIGLRMEW